MNLGEKNSSEKHGKRYPGAVSGCKDWEVWPLSEEVFIDVRLLFWREEASAQWLNQTVVGESELGSPNVDKNVEMDKRPSQALS